MKSRITQEQLDKLTVVLPNGSDVLCLVCVEASGLELGVKIAVTDLATLKNCMVTPSDDWRCPTCESTLWEGRGWGRCPSCKSRRWARRSGWVYIVACACVETAEQRKAEALRQQKRAEYYEKEALRDNAGVSPAMSAAYNALRLESTNCLEAMPGRKCMLSKTALPYDYCVACPRFDKEEKPAARVGTPLAQASFTPRPGWKDPVPMTDVSLSDADYAAVDAL